MITALIPLPNFALPPGLNSTTTFVSNCSDLYEDDVAMYKRGRLVNLNRQPALYKYKIIMSEAFNDLLKTKEFLRHPDLCMSESEIVFVSTEPIDLLTYECNPYAVIYPLYGKVGGQTYVFAKSVERLMKLMDFYSTAEILTPMEFIQEKVALFGGITPAETGCVTDYAPVYWKISMEEAVNTIMNANSVHDFSGKENVLNEMITPLFWIPDMFPQMFQLASEAVSWNILKMYMNAFADRTNNVRCNVLSSMNMWPSLYQHLSENGRIFTTPYNTLTARMDLLVYYAHAIGSDFFVTVDLSNDHFDVPDLYMQRIEVNGTFSVGGPQRSGLIKEFVRQICQAVDNAWAGNKVRIHKSCMEDVVVLDANTQEILMYIDLVWWTIAASNGLIDRVAKE